MRFFTIAALATAFSAGADAPEAGDFRMTVMDVFTITGVGVVITGIVEGGPVALEDVVCLRPAEGERRELTVKGVERGRQVLERAEPGMAVALVFEGIERDDAERGDELTAGCD